MERIIWGNTIERWIISAAIIVSSLIIGHIIAFLMRSIAKPTKWKIAEVVADRVGGPVLIFVLLFKIRSPIFSAVLLFSLSALFQNFFFRFPA